MVRGTAIGGGGLIDPLIPANPEGRVRVRGTVIGEYPHVTLPSTAAFAAVNGKRFRVDHPMIRLKTQCDTSGAITDAWMEQLVSTDTLTGVETWERCAEVPD